MFINLRMMDVFDSDKIFGNLPIICFGDLLQLEPVNGQPPYQSLNPKKAQRLTGGVPCAIDLWKTFQYAELTTNHRQGGEENEQWRNLLSHVRFGLLDQKDIDILHERLIDTSGCKSKDDYLDVYLS